MAGRASIVTAQSRAVDTREAAREFHAQVSRPDMALVVFFCSSAYDLDALAEEMRTLFAGVPVVGCTTAGEIGPLGCGDYSLTGASFGADQFSVACGHLDKLQQFDIARGRAFAEGLVDKLACTAPQADKDNSFAFLLIDGSSGREEPVTRALQSALGEVPLVGGSAGDGLDFGATYVYIDGSFHRDGAVLVLATTPLPFSPFKTQHFVAMDQRMVVTQADTASRTVSEIDGLPAADQYAEILGIESADLEPARFAASPVVVMIDGTNYVRAIQSAAPDGSLKFFCAIEDGLVLRVARGIDLVANLEQAFGELRTEIGQPQLVLAFDCILRKLEIAQHTLGDRVSRLFRDNNAVGFNTYGEQFHGVHVNQTLVGIAIGSEAA